MAYRMMTEFSFSMNIRRFSYAVPPNGLAGAS